MSLCLLKAGFLELRTCGSDEAMAKNVTFQFLRIVRGEGMKNEYERSMENCASKEIPANASLNFRLISEN